MKLCSLFSPNRKETSVESLKLMCAENKQVYDVISLKIHFLHN